MFKVMHCGYILIEVAQERCCVVVFEEFLRGAYKCFSGLSGAS